MGKTSGSLQTQVKKQQMLKVTCHPLHTETLPPRVLLFHLNATKIEPSYLMIVLQAAPVGLESHL